MQQGQVSVWVPIVVGFLGVIGVVLGQLVNAWREDRRWKREQERDDLRWRRERTEEEAKRRHDREVQWHERKLEFYSSLINLVEQIETETRMLATSMRLEDPKEERVREQARTVAKLRYGYRDSLAKVELLADDTIETCCRVFNDNLNENITIHPSGSIRSKVDEIGRMSTMSKEHRRELVTLARNELGLAPASVR